MKRTTNAALGMTIVSMVTVGAVTVGLRAQSGPATTTVADTVYRADGTPAQGSVVVAWPAFRTAGGTAVAGGTSSATLGTNGALSIALVPNAGATPAGVYYTAVYQLNDGTNKTEYWAVGMTSPENLATVRTTPGAGTAVAPVSLQYVNTALAAKANDSAVVHLGGTEMITGTKSFSAAPNVPAPVNSGDVANKNYVDTSVASVGAGNFLPVAGGTMTGTLTLSGNPAAPLQAAPKQYVDAGLAAKADLAGGHVPTSELGSGTAGSTSCLLGNGTWGACGSSANAISIQGTPVASTTPSNGQVLAYSSSSGQYTPQAGVGQTAGMQVVKWATDYNWNQTNSASLTTPGAQTLTLSSCPAGVTGSEPYYYVYISGTGTAEAVLVTGGTCAGNGASGTLQFVTANAHAAGYAIGSASSGLQEGMIAARTTLIGGVTQGMTVYAPAGEFAVYARVSVRSSNQTVDFTHAVFDCYMDDACIYVGDPNNANFTQNVTLIKPRGKPMVTGGLWPMIEVNGQATRLLDVSPKFNAVGVTFGTIVQVDGDQSFTLDGLNFSYGLGTIACNASFCGAVVTAPGPFSTNPAVGHIKDANISPQCGGNGVDWESGNTLEISDSVVQGYAQYGVRGGRVLGGYGSIKLVNVYEEAGCTNILGNVGTAGLIVNGGPVYWSGGEGPSGAMPLFANTGSTVWQYFVVARHATYGPSNPLFAGTAQTNGSGTITITTPDIAGAASFDLLKAGLPTSTTPVQAPYGTGNYAVATNVARSGACSNGVCTFTDTQAAPASYTVATAAYYPKLSYWPGSIVLAASADGNSPLSASTLTLTTDDFSGGAYSVNAVLGTHAPSIYANKCPLLSQFSPVWLSCLGANFPPETNYQQNATVLATKPGADGGLAAVANLKGRLNFSTSGSAPGHIITLVDTNFQKTVATANHRPFNDVNDTFIGIDQGGASAAGLSFGSALSISHYVGNVGDGTHFLERLTATTKTVNVPMTVNAPVTLNAGQGTAPMSVTSTTMVPNLNANFLNGAQTATTGTAGAIPVAGSNGKLDASWLQGIGTVNGGSQSQVAVYSGNGAAVSGDAALTDNGTTLSYSGTGGLSAASGTFRGNLTVNGQLLVAGPWMVSSPIPGTAMGDASPGNSALGISNDGNFYISANGGIPQKVATGATSSYFGNLFQEDSNDVGEYGAAAQNLHVYSSYTNSSTWQRTTVGYDATDNYAVLKSENSASGAAPGLGFWVNSGLKWVIDATSNLKPWTDQSYNIGTFNASSGTGLRPGTIFAAGNSTSGSGFELGKFANESYELCNDTTNGTVINGLAVLTSAGCAAKPGSALTSGAIGVVIGNAGTSGTVTLARTGSAYCSFDGTATVVGDYVVPSSVASSGFYPLCHDAGATQPSGTQILGRVLQATSGSATAQIWMGMPGSGNNSGAGTGSCTNQVVTALNAGAAPTCSSITSAMVNSSIATTASPALTGTPTAPTATAGDNSTKIATTAYVKNEVVMTWTCPVAGSTAVSQNCNWTVPAGGLTITGLDFAANTAPAGCTTYATVQLWDGTSSAEVGSYSIPMTSGNNFYTQVAGSTNVTAGHLLRVKVTTAAAGCTTNAAGMVATVSYQMGN